MSLNNIETHREQNIDIAAFLKAAGIPVVWVDTTDPKNLVWHFSQPRQCEELVSDFYAGTAKINPQTVLLEAKRLKDQVFETRRRNGGYRDEGKKY